MSTVSRIPVDRFTKQDFFHQYRKRNQPAIILNLLPQQPSWDLD